MSIWSEPDYTAVTAFGEVFPGDVPIRPGGRSSVLRPCSRRELRQVRLRFAETDGRLGAGDLFV